jgi:hypothetical protein
MHTQNDKTLKIFMQAAIDCSTLRIERWEDNCASIVRIYKPKLKKHKQRNKEKGMSFVSSSMDSSKYDHRIEKINPRS